MMGRSLLVSTLLLGAAGCSSEAHPPHDFQEHRVVAERCLVRLHGKGGQGSPATDTAGVAIISPNGNAEGWGGWQWLYFPSERYDEAISKVEAAVAGCDRIILNGFSNGGAFAAKLVCSGEDFDGRLHRVVVDDPVPDAATETCRRAEAVKVTLYWTGALEKSGGPGTQCTRIDWTCEGSSLVGIEAFAASLGTEVQKSRHDEHTWYEDAPELSQWE